uniref:Uncharacterized protein n=1 Tax=Tetradesmus obliquus TaxID=3088 RepID=A0A383WQ39_TETOB|eukprot:jgi/Sobl393_1/19843/SZX78856.1
MEEQQLLQELGVAVQDAAELEQDIIGKALAESPAAGPSADVPDGEAGTAVSPEQLAGQLLAAELEAEAVTLVLQAQQQQLQQEGGDDWNATDEQAAAQATERSSRQLEAAVTRQRLHALQEQQQQLQQTIAQLPQAQQAAVQQQHHRQKLAMLLQQQQQGRKGKGKAGKQQQGLQEPGQHWKLAGSSSSRAGAQASWDPAGAAGASTKAPLFGPSPQQQLWQQRQQQRATTAAELNIDALAAAAIAADGAAASASTAGGGLAGPKLVETERDRLIRLGLLTPFDKLEGFEKKVQGSAAAAAPEVRQVRFGTAAQQLQQRRKQQQQQEQEHMLPPRPPPQQHSLPPAQQQQQQFEQPSEATLSTETVAAAAEPAAGALLPPRPRPPRAAALPQQPAAAADEQWAMMQQRRVASTASPPSSSAAAAAAASGLGDMANAVGRSGLPLSELLAKASQQSMEQGVLQRPRTVLLEGDNVPQQERELIKVNPLLWRGANAAAAAGAPLAKRPRRHSTLPRQKRARMSLAALTAAVHGSAEVAAKDKRQRRQQDGAAAGSSSSSDGWASDGEHGSSSADEQEEGEVADAEQREGIESMQLGAAGAAAAAVAAAAAAAAAAGQGDGQAAGVADKGRGSRSARRRRGNGSSSGGGEDAGTNDDAEYLPSDVEVGTSRSRSRSKQSAAAADVDDDDMEGLVEEPVGIKGRGRKGSSSSKSRSSAKNGSSKRGRGSTPSSPAAAAAAAADSEEQEEDELLQLQAAADTESGRDEIADYDDVDPGVYQLRMERYAEQLEVVRQKRQQQLDAASMPAGDAAAEAAAGPADAGSAAADDADDVVFDGGFRVPGALWAQLFDYQRTGVKWLWELHTQRAGGIIGDEMGLGKTIQVIAYLAGLHHSGLWRPSLVVAPATVLRQWMGELRTWYPPLRVMLLHDSGRCPYGTPRPDKAGIVAAALEAADCSILLTTYDQLRLNRELLLPVRWGVAVLDEGHKIRNPDAEVTLASKQLQTVHRIIMSGSPIQNRLSELWSLFDFIFPGKLGTLPVFTAQFAVPITIGGYTNASKLQVQTAYRCAVVLRDLIGPYLLRRRKADVATQLPKKTETVLFCSLTQQQRDLYRAYINSSDVSEILSGHRQALAGIDVLRKICNHPDLLERAAAQANTDYGEPSRSGKLQVLAKVLAAWHAERHKVLLFTQTQQMLDILEKLAAAAGYSYHRMDGSTPIAQRGRLMDDFNGDPDRFLFLLTTKVGGLGVNLTGANRVLIYDPDWNPSTDSQARERAWRIGQGRPVTIYRLITSGTIEEKVYHRQIYKSFLTNKVLQDPRQRRFFASKDISDLFTLSDEYGAGTKSTTAAARSAGAGHAAAGATETGRIFSDVVGEQLLAPVQQQQQRQLGSSLGGGSKVRKFGRQQQQQQQAKDTSVPPPAAGSAGNGIAAQYGAVAAAAAAAAGDAAGSSAAGAADDEASVLRDLFEGTGIKSLIDHSSIEGANSAEAGANTDDAFAAKVAADAAEALRRSSRACQSAAVHVPTWTGRHGAAGMAAAAARGNANSSRGAAAAGGGSSRSSPAAPGGNSSAGRSRFGQVRNPLLLDAPPLFPTAGGAAAAAAAAAAGGGSSREASPARAPAAAVPDPAPQAAGQTEDAAAADAAAGVGSAGEQRFGAGGSSSSRPFAGVQAGAAGAGAAPSSSALLARMRERQAAAAAAAGRGQLGAALPLQQQGLGTAAAAEDVAVPSPGGSGRSSADVSPSRPPHRAAGNAARGSKSSSDPAARMAEQIVQFIQAAGGCANSDLLLSHFRDVLRESDMPLFKQQLRQVAQLTAAPAAAAGAGRGAMQGAGTGGSKVWVLRSGGQ